MSAMEPLMLQRMFYSIITIVIIFIYLPPFPQGSLQVKQRKQKSIEKRVIKLHIQFPGLGLLIDPCELKAQTRVHQCIAVKDHYCCTSHLLGELVCHFCSH